MKVLAKYSIANLKKNKKRTIMTIIGVALSCALLLTMTGMAASFHYLLIDSAIDVNGNFHQMYEAIPGDKLEIIEHDENVASFYYSELVDDSHFENRDWYIGSSVAYPPDTYQSIDEVTDRSPNHLYNIFVKYKNLAPDTVRNTEKRILEELGGDNNYNIRDNYNLMSAHGYLGNTPKLIIRTLALVVYSVLVLTSVFIIRNSFSISATERTQQYGVLMSVGARPRQIRRLVYLDALFIGIIAIPAGIALGALAQFILVQIVNLLIGEFTDTQLHTVIPLFVPLFIIGLGAIIVFLSSASAAIRASLQTPISAIRNYRDIKINNKKYKTSKTAESLWGIGGVIASKNLKRSRQKYHTTVISIVVSVAIFIGLSSFTTYVNRLIDLQYPNVDASYQVYGNNTKALQKIINNTAHKNAAYYIQEYGTVQSDIIGQNNTMNILIADDATFRRYAEQIGIKSVDSGQLVIMNDTVVKSGRYARITDTKVGDVVTLKLDDILLDENGSFVDFRYHNVDFSVGAITDTIPFGQELMSNTTLIVSEKYYQFDQLMGERDDQNMISAVLYMEPDGHNSEITHYIQEQMAGSDPDFSGIVLFDLETEFRALKNIVLLFAIFTYGFIIVISLIGVTNIFNTITTNVELRAKEFAILKSVGMTKDEFNRMIRVESLMYTSRALIIGIPLGLLISYGIFRSVSDSGIELDYMVPWVPIIISVASVGLLVWAIMAYSTRQVSKQNIIDTIRNDSI